MRLRGELEPVTTAAVARTDSWRHVERAIEPRAVSACSRQLLPVLFWPGPAAVSQIQAAGLMHDLADRAVAPSHDTLVGTATSDN